MAASKRIANPGCYPTGMIASFAHWWTQVSYPKKLDSATSISRYSACGKQLMAIHQTGRG